jgi:hypothetical protein
MKLDTMSHNQAQREVMKRTYDAEIKFRCQGDWRARFEALAKLERRDVSDLARLVFEDYITSQEKALERAGRLLKPRKAEKAE